MPRRVPIRSRQCFRESILCVARRALQILREEGLRSLWFKILSRLCYRRVIILVRDFDETEREPNARLPVKVGTLQPDEIREYGALRPDTDPGEIQRRLATGHICFTARMESRIIHVCWIATSRAWIAYLEREIQMAPDEVYAYELFTAAEFRGMNVSAARSECMKRTLRHSGYRRAVAAVMPENKGGYKAVEKAGYRPVGILRTFWIGRWRLHFGKI